MLQRQLGRCTERRAFYIRRKFLSKATYNHSYTHIDTPTAQSTMQCDSQLVRSSQGIVSRSGTRRRSGYEEPGIELATFRLQVNLRYLLSFADRTCVLICYTSILCIPSFHLVFCSGQEAPWEWPDNQEGITYPSQGGTSLETSSCRWADSVLLVCL